MLLRRALAGGESMAAEMWTGECSANFLHVGMADERS
jgi:hypothetical protein